LITALHQLGLNVTTVIAGAGVLGLAIGFGAQTLVRDVISGFFLIFDGVIETGDHITFNQVSGTVEVVGLRMTQIRSLDGRLWYVPNGELKIVGNFNREWSRAVVNIPLAHEQNIAGAMSLIQEVAQQWAQEHEDIVLEPPEAQGVLMLGASSIDVRVVVKVRAMEHWAVERELARLIKDAFDDHGFELPIPRQVIYHREDPKHGTDPTPRAGVGAR
ncbi:MAG: mechanosensitive ion channel family protein, partial [Deltaproteobacteria bacterium]|nr:mechanosensitive ion channel family protein [Deltaproteobacteria bacterium]